MNMRLVSQTMSVIALTVTAFGFFFALFVGSFPIALLQAGLFGLNVYTAIGNKLFQG